MIIMIMIMMVTAANTCIAFTVLLVVPSILLILNSINPNNYPIRCRCYRCLHLHMRKHQEVEKLAGGYTTGFEPG